MFRIPIGARDSSGLQNVQTGSVVRLASYSMVAGLHTGGQSGRDMKLTTHLHPVPRLKMSGAVLYTPYMPV